MICPVSVTHVIIGNRCIRSWPAFTLIISVDVSSSLPKNRSPSSGGMALMVTPAPMTISAAIQFGG